jgi:hypothetical protein
MERIKYGARRAIPWLIGAAAVGATLALYIVMINKAPYWLNPALQTPQSAGPSGAPPTLTPGERLTAAHNARFLIVSIAGALVVLTGLAFTAFNYRLAHRGQATERFTQALERLGSDELYVRIGGIHALQRLLRDSASLHTDIVEVLVAFIRERAPHVKNADATHNPVWPRSATPTEPAADVQAALTAIANRPRRPTPTHNRINLAHLHLQFAHLPHAELRNANLHGARLNCAYLGGANLQGANLTGAELLSASLGDAQLKDARLIGAQLQHADLKGAQLKGAYLGGAQLQGADLKYATGLTKRHISIITVDADTILPAGITESRPEPASGSASSTLPESA